MIRQRTGTLQRNCWGAWRRKRTVLREAAAAAHFPLFSLPLFLNMYFQWYWMGSLHGWKIQYFWLLDTGSQKISYLVSLRRQKRERLDYIPELFRRRYGLQENWRGDVRCLSVPQRHTYGKPKMEISCLPRIRDLSYVLVVAVQEPGLLFRRFIYLLYIIRDNSSLKITMAYSRKSWNRKMAAWWLSGNTDFTKEAYTGSPYEDRVFFPHKNRSGLLHWYDLIIEIIFSIKN